jgi:hypothetical protein
VHAGEHHLRLLRMRASADLEGIEVGPELGRGSYGRVYKGACKVTGYAGSLGAMCDFSPTSA